MRRLLFRLAVSPAAMGMMGLMGAVLYPALQARAATTCSLASPGGVAIQAARPVALPALLKDCEGVKVERGEVVACVQDLRGRLSCRSFFAGETLSSANLGESQEGHGWLDAVMHLLRGEPAWRDAVGRGRAQNALPSGDVAFIDGVWQIDFTHPALSGVDRIVLSDAVSGARILSVDRGADAKIDVSMMIPGRSYVWTLRAKSAALDESSGKFRLLNQADRAATVAQAAHIRGEAGKGQAAVAVMLAAWLREHKLDFDARQVLRSGGFALD